MQAFNGWSSHRQPISGPFPHEDSGCVFAFVLEKVSRQSVRRTQHFGCSFEVHASAIPDGCHEANAH